MREQTAAEDRQREERKRLAHGLILSASQSPAADVVRVGAHISLSDLDRLSPAASKVWKAAYTAASDGISPNPGVLVDAMRGEPDHGGHIRDTLAATTGTWIPQPLTIAAREVMRAVYPEIVAEAHAAVAAHAAGGADADDLAAAVERCSETISRAQRALAALEGGGQSGGDGVPRVWPAADMEAATQPRWLARGRLPRAAISLLVGDEGIGKSLLWVWLVAAITRGKPLPEFGIPPRDPAPVMLVVTEDDWGTTVLPRLQVADADLTMVSVICTDRDGSGAPVFPRDMDLVINADPAPALIVVDAWLDTVPGGLRVRDPQQAREALHPWRDAATHTDAAVLLLTHTNRVASGNARDKYGATGELRKKARLTLFAQRDEEGNLVVGPEKANTTRPVAASMFTVEPLQCFPPTDDHDGTVPRLRYIGESDRTAGEHIADAHAAGDDGDDLTEVQQWLLDYVTENEPCPSLDAKIAGSKALGVSARTVARAAKVLRLHSESSGFPRTTHWSLPPP